MKTNYILIGLAIFCFVLLLCLAGLAYFYWAIYQERGELKLVIGKLEAELSVASTTIASTTANWQLEKERTDQLASQVSNLAVSVNTLDKLSKTDRELLKKYSRVYFLSEHFTPDRLATITPMYLYPDRKDLKIHANVQVYLERMLSEASNTGQKIFISSAYRSFGEQTTLKNGYKVSYGSGANKFSADQGYSEHQLGTAVDLSLTNLSPSSLKFGETEAYKWLNQNAHRYGFVLSYPKGNEYYQFEPWHWRFVGVALASKLHEEGKYFYDYPQRLIDTYLVNIFD